MFVVRFCVKEGSVAFDFEEVLPPEEVLGTTLTLLGVLLSLLSLAPLLLLSPAPAPANDDPADPTDPTDPEEPPAPAALLAKSCARAMRPEGETPLRRAGGGIIPVLLRILLWNRAAVSRVFLRHRSIDKKNHQSTKHINLLCGEKKKNQQTFSHTFLRFRN